jgi:hypothetical protein
MMARVIGRTERIYSFRIARFFLPDNRQILASGNPAQSFAVTYGAIIWIWCQVALFEPENSLMLLV